MDLFQEYKELYYKELEFKDSMSNKIGTSITFLTMLCTGHMFIWNIMVELQFVLKFFPIVFLLFEVFSVYYTVLSMYNFYKSYFKFKYYLVSAENIKSQIDYNNSLKNNFSYKKINKANYEMMCNTFYEYTICNRKENIRKNKYQMKLNSSIIKAIIFLILTYTIWIFIINQITF